ncbi:glycosyltransferase [Marinobacter nauticus]|uniref:glycosyltransferase n=1 Tax=Marinobacter nauticus TaxID=2743 RepID=UPI0012FB27DA|nr:glycosyltransferase [Marinobacter nauticus]
MSKPTAIFVLGMHRSGTSALAGALAASGVWLGDDLLEPAPGVNDKGFWEHKELVRINEALLERAGLHWYSPLAASRFASFEIGEVESLEDLRELAVRFASGLLYQGEERDASVVAIKDPRLCLTAGFWKRAFEEAGAQIAGLELVRHPAEVARSLERRDGMVPSHANVLWLDHLLASVSFCRGLDAAFLGSYDDLMSSPRAFTELAFKELAVPLAPKPDQLDKWIQQDLRHHAVSHGGAPGLLGDEVSLLYAEVVQRGSLDDTAASKLVSRVSAVFEDLEAQFQQYNRTVIQLQEVSAKLDELGREHTRALEVVAERDQQIAGANADKDRIGALHQQALETVALRDKELAARERALAEKEELIARSADDIATVREQLQNLGDQHHHAQLVVAERDHQLEVLNHRIASFERSLIGRVYRVWSRLRNGISPNRGNNNGEAGQSPSSAMAGVTRFPNSGQRPAVDVIIPVYGGFEETCAAVETAAGSIDYAWARLVIINDCSPVPEITQWLRENQHRLGYELLENEVNLGFVGTVNRGMRLRPDADVLLLNSDVEVANNWLERLQDCAYSREKVASVTATANNATICSFPVFCEDNELPRGFDVKRLDEVFAQSVPANMAVEIPTGVGCCMYMRRDSMDAIGLFDEEVFGRGYGEENDWCQRAISDGWSNLHALNVFVYHKGAVSFAEESDPRKEENLRALLGRYPAYNADVQAFIQQDPAKVWRTAAFVATLGRSELPKVLLLAHGMGGGVYTHIKELIREHPGLHYLLIEPATDGNIRLYLAPEQMPLYLDFRMDEEYSRLLSVLESAGVGHLHIHHTMGLPTRLWGLARDLAVTLDYTLHDYAIVNGNPSLLDGKGRFVGDDEKRDELCADRVPLPDGVPAQQWRENQLFLLEQARYLICPSDDMHRRLASVPEFSHLQNWVVTHHMDARSLQAGVVATSPESNLRVLVVGALSPEKGADVLEAVAKELAGVEIEFHLLGYAYRSLDKLVVTHGPYKEEEAVSRIREIEPHVLWFPAQCAETYSYTLSLALQLGLPVVASHIGAFPERLAGRNSSVLFSDFHSSPAWAAFWRDAVGDFDLILKSSVPDHLFAPSDEEFYERRYLEGLVASKDAPVLPMYFMGECLANAEKADVLMGRRERLFRILVKIVQTRFGSFVAKAFPVSVQRNIKRYLTRKPLH